MVRMTGSVVAKDKSALQRTDPGTDSASVPQRAAADAQLLHDAPQSWHA
jgi:hypothetical protein